MKKSRTEISLYKNQAIFFKKENFPPKFKTHLSELSGKKRQKKKIAKPAIETKPTEFESKCLDTIHRYLATPRVRSGQCFTWVLLEKFSISEKWKTFSEYDCCKTRSDSLCRGLL